MCHLLINDPTPSGPICCAAADQSQYQMALDASYFRRIMRFTTTPGMVFAKHVIKKDPGRAAGQWNNCRNKFHPTTRAPITGAQYLNLYYVIRHLHKWSFCYSHYLGRAYNSRFHLSYKQNFLQLLNAAMRRLWTLLLNFDHRPCFRWRMLSSPTTSTVLPRPQCCWRPTRCRPSMGTTRRTSTHQVSLR